MRISRRLPSIPRLPGADSIDGEISLFDGMAEIGMECRTTMVSLLTGICLMIRRTIRGCCSMSRVSAAVRCRSRKCERVSGPWLASQLIGDFEWSRSCACAASFLDLRVGRRKSRRFAEGQVALARGLFYSDAAPTSIGIQSSPWVR